MGLSDGVLAHGIVEDVAHTGGRTTTAPSAIDPPGAVVDGVARVSRASRRGVWRSGRMPDSGR